MFGKRVTQSDCRISNYHLTWRQSAMPTGSAHAQRNRSAWPGNYMTDRLNYTIYAHMLTQHNQEIGPSIRLKTISVYKPRKLSLLLKELLPKYPPVPISLYLLNSILLWVWNLGVQKRHWNWKNRKYSLWSTSTKCSSVWRIGPVSNTSLLEREHSQVLV